MTTSRAPKPWHNDCTRLRAEGLDPGEIADRVGKARDMVLWVLDENGERDKARERARKSRGQEKRTPYHKRPYAGVYHVPLGRVKPAARVAKAPISAEDRQEALNAFLGGHIGPSELARRLVP